MTRFDDLISRRFALFYGLLLAAAGGMFGVFSLDTMVWADEAYTFALLPRTFGEIWTITAADVHPPLYYFLLKILTAPFGYDLLVCRFVSALPCLLLMAIGGWQMKKLFNERTALLFMALYLLFPYIMTYTTEVRMYSLAECLVTLNALWAYRCWKENNHKDWAIFALTGTCAAYTHYFALVSVGICYGLLFLLILAKNRKLLKGWTLASAATILLFLPWLGSFVSQLVYKVNNEYWIEPITLSTVVSYVISVFGANGLGAFALYAGLAYAAALAALLLSGNKEGIYTCLFALAIPLGTVAVGLLASILVRPVFVIRYILPSLPLAVFFFAYVLGHVKSEMLFASLMTVAVMGGSSNLLVRTGDVLSRDLTCLRTELVSRLPQADAYVVFAGNTMHASQELSYCDPVTPIYTVDTLGADNPYPNRMPFADFRAADNPSVILVLKEGQGIPEAFADAYEAELLYNVDVSGTQQSLWHLRAK